VSENTNASGRVWAAQASLDYSWKDLSEHWASCETETWTTNGNRNCCSRLCVIDPCERDLGEGNMAPISKACDHRSDGQWMNGGVTMSGRQPLSLLWEMGQTAYVLGVER